MRRLLALAALLAAACAAAAILGPCDDQPSVATPPTVATAVATGTVAAPAPKPARHRARAEPGEVEEDEPVVEDADVQPFKWRFRVVARANQAPVAGADIDLEGLRATTGADGQATIEGFRGRRNLTHVRARGFVPHIREATVPDEGETVLVELDAGVVVPVEVVDGETGRPVAGATVGFHKDARTVGAREYVETGEDGRGEAWLAPRMTLLVRVRAPRHVDAMDFVTTGEAGASQPALRIRVAPAGTVSGRVLGPDGEPVAGVVVLLFSEPDGMIQCEPSGEDGRFEGDGLVFGRQYRLRANPPANVGWAHSPETATVTATREGPATNCDLRFRHMAEIEVVVADDAEEGRPAVGFFLKLLGDESETTSSGADGTWSNPVEPGRYTLKVWLDERLPSVETFDVPVGAKVKREIRLSRGESVTGFVFDESGAPVEDVWIETTDPEVDPAAPRARGHTKEDGRFEMSLLAKGPHELVLEPPFAFEATGTTRVVAPSDDVRIMMRRRGVLKLTAVVPEGDRIAPDSRITFHAERGGEPWDFDRLLPSDGRFDESWPSEVRGEVTIVVDGFLPVTRAIAVQPGGTMDLGEIALRRGVALRGVLVDESGKGLSRHQVLVQGPSWSPDCTTDEGGRFVLAGLTPGKVRLDVEGYPGSTFEVVLPRADEAVLTLKRKGRIEVVVFEASGAPAPGRALTVRDPSGALLAEDATDCDGNWGYDIGPGTYTIEAAGGLSGTAEVRSGEVSVVRLR